MTANTKKTIQFDADKCIGCYACVVSCMDQNDIDVAKDGLSWRHVEIVQNGDGVPGCTNVSIACMHCEDATCIDACPAGAIVRDSKTGDVIVREALCIGCHACAMACPFGAPRFGSNGKMQKCDGCYARTQFGLEPACVRNCPTGALVFTGVNDAMEAKAAAAARSLT